MSSYRMKYKIGATQYHIPVVDDMAGFGSGIPLGTILPYSANTQNPPEGFLFCDGSAISRAMYPDLFSLIGTLYGSGDGSTTFNLPDYSFVENYDAQVSGKAVSWLTDTIMEANSAPADAAYGISYGSGGMSQVQRAYGSYLYADGSKLSVEVTPIGSATVHYIIKAFSATTSNSELIDITQYASALNGKPSKSLNDLSQAGEDHFLEKDWCYIYPNGGSEESPANVSVDNRYVMNNPFPGYIVNTQVEVYFNSQWGDTGWFDYAGNYAIGARSSQLDNDSIVIQIGNHPNCLTTYGNISGSSFGQAYSGISLPCRVKVWKIGKIPT